MGALVGALTASGLSPRVLANTVRREVIEGRPFADYGIPHVALTRAKSARSMLAWLSGETMIEELPSDSVSVSADLVSAEMIVHRSGSVVNAVGASMSLPGLAPPVRDGAPSAGRRWRLNNLPVETVVTRSEGTRYRG
jgi:NTE family protein